MGTSSDVGTEVDAPHSGAVHLVAVNDDIRGFALLRVVLRVSRVPLHKELILAVTISIANGDVVGRVAATVVSHCGVRLCQGNLHGLGKGLDHRSGFYHCSAGIQYLQLILVGQRTLYRQSVTGALGFHHLLTIAVETEGLVLLTIKIAP